MVLVQIIIYKYVSHAENIWVAPVGLISSQKTETIFTLFYLRQSVSSCYFSSYVHCCHPHFEVALHFVQILNQPLKKPSHQRHLMMLTKHCSQIRGVVSLMSQTLLVVSMILLYMLSTLQTVTLLNTSTIIFNNLLIGFIILITHNNVKMHIFLCPCDSW